MRTTITRLTVLVAVLITAAAAAVAGLSPAPSRPGLATAADLSQFNPGNIISDAIFFDGGTMSAAEIAAFINVKGSACTVGSDGTPCLKNYRQDTTQRPADAYCNGYAPGAAESAATIIYKTSVSCDINARVLLVMLQKEQALVTATSARVTASRYQKAMGFACPDTAACDTTYYGFQNQVYSAARQFQRYAANAASYQYRAGRTTNVLYNPDTNCGSSPVYIQNQATAGLYIYTPYQPNAAALAAGYGSGDDCSAYGNRNFWNYFTDWFGSTQTTAAWANLPFGAIDAVTSSYGQITAGGWVLDPDAVDQSLSVNVYIDGVFAVSGVANGPRPDVGAIYAGAGSAHGYSATTVAPLGLHQVCVYAMNIGAGTVNPQLGCRMVDNQDPGAPVGSLDRLVADPGVITVGGWVFDPDAPNQALQAHVYVDGKFTKSLTAGDPRPDVGAAFGVGPDHGFNDAFAATAGDHTVCMYAINVGPGSVNTGLACRPITVPDPASYNPAGALDSVRASGGTVQVGGWVYDRDIPTSPLAVHIYVDGAFAGHVDTSVPRPDVAAYLGVGPATGFYWTGVLPAGSHQVCVFAINVGYGTANPLLGCRTVTTVGGTAANPIGVVDGAAGGPGTLSAVGWAYDVDTPTLPVEVHAYVDNAFAGSTLAAGSRPDVGRVIAGAGDNHGFSWSGTAAAGSHQVCLYSINVGAGNANTPLGCRTVTVTDPEKAHDPFGSLDAVGTSAGAITFGGWAMDPDIPTGPATVHFYLDGAFFTAVSTGDPRPDIDALIPGAGPAHGFNWAGPAPSGRHQICAYVINVGRGTMNTPLACRTVTVG